MNFRFTTRFLVLFLLGLGMTSTLFGEAQSFEKRVELDDTEGIKHRLPFDFYVQPGEQTALTISGSQLFHDALIISTKNGGVDVDLDLVVLCPYSRQKFAKSERFPSKRYNGFNLEHKNRRDWTLKFGKDCNVTAQDLGYPIIELTTQSLAWIEVSHSGTVRAEEMVNNHVRIDTTGLASVELDRIQAEKVHLSGTGSSDLSIEFVNANTSYVSLSGLADIDLGSLDSASIEFRLSGSSKSNTSNIMTSQIVLALSGLSDFVVDKLHTTEDQTNSNVEVSTIDLSGSADISVQSLRLSELKLKANGLSDLTLGNVATKKMKLSASGSADVVFKNLITEESQIASSGLVDVEVNTLESDVVDIQASGSADVRVLKANVQSVFLESTGISNVQFKGGESSGLRDR